MVSVSGSALDSLRQGFGGELLSPGDAGYNEARSLWNGDIDRRPALIACASSADDIAAAIRFGREQDLELAVRGGGGNFGVVTDFEFSTHDVGPLVNLGLFFWSVDNGGEALRFIRDFVATLPDGVAAQVIGL